MTGKGALRYLLSYTVFKTAIGWCGLVMAQNKMLKLFIGYSRPRQLIKHIPDEFGDEVASTASSGMEMMIKRIKDYCSGEKVALAGLPMDWSSLTPFQRKVFRAAMQIPYGSVDTYGGLARKIGSPKSARAVGNALAKNPFPLIVPCHRIIRGDGSMGGFSAGDGITLKKRLLNLEMKTRIDRQNKENFY